MCLVCMHVCETCIHACIPTCMDKCLDPLRVAIFGALMLQPGCLCLVAPDCRSWGTPARGTSWRSKLNPLGLGYNFVVAGNRMASRLPGGTHARSCMPWIEVIFSARSFFLHACCFPLRVTLICLLVMSVHGIFIVEQPRQSLLYDYFRWQWFQQRISWVSCLKIQQLAFICVSIVWEECPLKFSGTRSQFLAYEVWILFTQAITPSQ